MFLEDERIENLLIEDYFKFNNNLKLIDTYQLDIQIEKFVDLVAGFKIFGEFNVENFKLCELILIEDKYFPKKTLHFGKDYTDLTNNMENFFRRIDLSYIDDGIGVARVIEKNFNNLGILKYFEILKDIKSLKISSSEYQKIIGKQRYNFILDNIDKGSVAYEPLEKIKLEK